MALRSLKTNVIVSLSVMGAVVGVAVAISEGGQGTIMTLAIITVIAWWIRKRVVRDIREGKLLTSDAAPEEKAHESLREEVEEGSSGGSVYSSDSYSTEQEPEESAGQV